jgi:hypothetical protein
MKMIKQDIERVARGLILVATESSRLLVSQKETTADGFLT